MENGSNRDLRDLASVARLQDLDYLKARFGGLALSLGNYAVITQGSTTNGEGSGGPTACALVCLTAQVSGIFLWWASAEVAAATAADVSTFTMTSQTGTGTPTVTGGGAPSGYFYGPTANPLAGPETATATAGTGLVITAGGGSAKTQYVRAETLGTGSTGDSFTAVGVMQNSVTAAGTRTPFTKGNNVFLLLSYTNTAANRVLSDINLGLLELPF